MISSGIRAVWILAVATVALTGCGGPPADVAGSWAGAYNLLITGTAGVSGQEGIVVSQKGGDIQFLLAGCQVRASASGETQFNVHDFRCTQQAGDKMWTLEDDGGGRITTTPTTFSLNVKGDAIAGSESAPFTLTFSGTR